MTVSEAMRRAGALIENARTTLNQHTGAPCSACGTVPFRDRKEHKMNLHLRSLAEKCQEVAAGEFGGRVIGKRGSIHEQPGASTPAHI